MKAVWASEVESRIQIDGQTNMADYICFCAVHIVGGTLNNQ